MEMQGLKPSVLMGKLKQHLPPGVSTDNDLFLAMFLIRLLSSMREVVRAGTHKTVAAMVKAVDATKDAQGGHNSTVAAASTQCSSSPAPHNRKQGDKTSDSARSKSHPLPTLIFILSKTLAMASVNFTTITPTRLRGVLRPGLGQKTN